MYHWILLLFLVLPNGETYVHVTETIPVHENSGKTHVEGGTGPCHGWARAGANMRVCYINKERTQCKYLIYVHGAWHEGEPFPCTELEVNNEQTQRID
jgi:hypothetical protein